MSVRFALLSLAMLPMALAAATATPRAPAVTATHPERADVGALRAKAERGNAIAQYNLGLAYAQGRGTPADPIEAFAWLTLAAENGSTEASLETVLDTLTKAQLSAARARLGELRRTHPSLRTASGGQPASAPLPLPGTDLATLQAQLEDAQSSLAAQSAELAARRAEVETMRIELARTQAALAHAQTQIEQLSSARTQSQDTRDTGATAAAAKLRSELAALHAQVDLLERARDAARAEQSASAQHAATLAAELATARQDASTSTMHASEAAAAHRQEIAAANQQLVSTRAELAEAGSASHASAREREALEARVAELSASLAAAPAISTAELDALRERALAAETNAARAETELATARGLLAAARAQPPLASTQTPVAATVPLRPQPGPDALQADARVRMRATATPPVSSRPAPRVHTVAIGETLSGISRRYYGTPSRWPEIFNANQDVIRNERSLVVGRTLRIP